MSIIRQNKKVIAVKRGTSTVAAVKRGTRLVYQSAVPEVIDYDILAEFVPSSETRAILGSKSNVSKIWINDIEVDVSTNYTFQTIGETYTIKYKLIDNTQINTGLFYQCDDLISIELSDSITSIGINSFTFCSGLTSITIPDGVTTIGGSAFLGCSSLTSIDIPSSVTTISDKVFKDCNNLAEITCNATTAPTLGSDAFNGVPASVVLNYPCGSDYSTWIDMIGCEDTCESLNEDWTESLGSEWDIEVYYNTSRMMPQVLPFTLYKYGDNVERMWVDGVEVTPSATYAFADTAEHTVAYKFKEPRIQGSMFSGITGVLSVTIYPTVQEVGVRAFKGCTKMTSIVLRGAPPTLAGTDVFEGASTSGTLYSPNGYDCSTWLSVLGDGWSEVKYDV